MNDLSPPTLFLDAALMVAALFSEHADSPGRRLFKLGEARLVHLDTSEDALREANHVLRDLLGQDYDTVKLLLAENLALANVAVTPPPNDATIRGCVEITKYLPDARVLAAAIERGCEVFVTYDRQHLLGNPDIGPPHTRLVVMTGGEAFDWAVEQVKVRSRLRLEQKRRVP